MIPIPYEPRCHRVAETDFAKFVRKELKDPLLFTYLHLWTGNWVLAVWASESKEPGDLIQELLILGKTPCGTTEHVRKLRLFRPGCPEGIENQKKNKRDLALQNRRWDVRATEENKELNDHARVVREYENHTKPRISNPGFSPVAVTEASV